MLKKDDVKTLIASSLYGFYNEILKDKFATEAYVDGKSLPIIFINDDNKTGDKLFPLLPEHNLVFIAGDAQLTDSNNVVNILYGLCYSDLQDDGSKLLTEYRTGKAAKLNSSGVLESFEYINTDIKSIVSNIKGGESNKVLAKNSDTDFDYKWVDVPSTDYVDDLINNNKVTICTDEEVNNMLTEVLGGDYSGN